MMKYLQGWSEVAPGSLSVHLEAESDMGLEQGVLEPLPRELLFECGEALNDLSSLDFGVPTKNVEIYDQIWEPFSMIFQPGISWSDFHRIVYVALF